MQTLHAIGTCFLPTVFQMNVLDLTDKCERAENKFAFCFNIWQIQPPILVKSVARRCCPVRCRESMKSLKWHCDLRLMTSINFALRSVRSVKRSTSRISSVVMDPHNTSSDSRPCDVSSCDVSTGKLVDITLACSDSSGHIVLSRASSKT